MKRLTVGQRIDAFLDNRRLRWVVMGMVLLGAGVAGGMLIPPPHAAQAEVTPQLPPKAFETGDQLALPILRDINATLHQVDARLARLEAIFKELSTPRQSAPAGN